MQWFNKGKNINSIQNEDNAREDDVGKKGHGETLQELKYQHPKIMLLDIDAATLLKSKGYNVVEASLGKPYEVTRSNSLQPLGKHANLPHNYKEQEVVIVDLHYEFQILDNPSPELAEGVDGWWVSNKQGYVNPRLLNGKFVRDDFDRILNTGGVFIIFAKGYEAQEFIWGNSYKYFNAYEFNKKERDTHSNWNFLSLTAYISYLDIINDHGSMMKLADDLPKESTIAQILLHYLDDSTYSCTLSPGYEIQREWLPLVVNKFGNAVSGVIIPTDERKGIVFIFPNIKNKAQFLVDFISEYLPSVSPTLFPEMEKVMWTNQPEYELASITNLKKQVVEIQEKTRLEIEGLEKRIHSQKEQTSYIFDLASQTGDALVTSVQKALEVLGFQKIIDVDKELRQQGIQGRNREDLQIHDSDPTLLLEVKGISNHPTDDDVLAVQKYVVLRMREWGRVNVRGLCIVNHHRHLPPLDRTESPFREELLAAVEEEQIGLITGWDLHKLVRNFIHHGWQHNNIKDLFYKIGRISIIPNHYQYIGTIERFIEKSSVVGIKLTEQLKKGEFIAYELPILFKEEICDSLQFENENIDEAQAGMLVGLKTTLSKEEAKVGVRAYRVLKK
jgi:hypothetical protein